MSTTQGGGTDVWTDMGTWITHDCHNVYVAFGTSGNHGKFEEKGFQVILGIINVNIWAHI